LDRVGLAPRDDEILRSSLQEPFGMIIVTGPPGPANDDACASLAVIKRAQAQDPDIEDPIENHISGINQTQIHPAIGLTFAAALRSFLRHDPDVIMVGEMRRRETAHIRRACGADGPSCPDHVAPRPSVVKSTWRDQRHRLSREVQPPGARAVQRGQDKMARQAPHARRYAPSPRRAFHPP